MPPLATPKHADQRLNPRDRLVIGILLVSTFVVILNETIMAVALPHLMDSLQVGAGAVQWLTTAFLITMAVVIPVTGFLIQRMRTRAIFIGAMSLFLAGTLICAVAPGLAVLILGRDRPGVGHGDHAAAADDHGDDAGAADNARQDDGQYLHRHLGGAGARPDGVGRDPPLPARGASCSSSSCRSRWRAGDLGARRITQRRRRTRYAPLDIVSVILSAVGFGGLVYGLSSFGEAAGDTGPVPGWVVLVVGVVAMAVFILRQLQLQKTDRAFLDLRTFASRTSPSRSSMLALMHDRRCSARSSCCRSICSTCSASTRCRPACCCCRAGSSWACWRRRSAGSTTATARGRC